MPGGFKRIEQLLGFINGHVSIVFPVEKQHG